MRVVGLLSGGKDSCFNLCHCVLQGHEVVALATLIPPHGKDEIDSYMYQTVGHDAVEAVAQAMGIPLYRRTIAGAPLNQSAAYGDRDAGGATDARDETEDLYELLQLVKAKHPDVDAVSAGAILSNYQRVRVEHVALRPELQLQPLAFLWMRDQTSLLSEMVQSGLVAMVIKCAGIGLTERDLGKTLAQLQPKLEQLHSTYGAHVCGEGGEYETLTLDSPLFEKRLAVTGQECVVHADAAFASVTYLRITETSLEAKGQSGRSAVLEQVRAPPLFDAAAAAAVDTAKALAASAENLPGAVDAAVEGEGLAAVRSHSCHKAPWLAVADLCAPAGERTSVAQETEAVLRLLQSACPPPHHTAYARHAGTAQYASARCLPPQRVPCVAGRVRRDEQRLPAALWSRAAVARMCGAPTRKGFGGAPVHGRHRVP